MGIGDKRESFMWILLGEFDWGDAKEEEIFVLGVWEKGVLELNL